MAEYSPNTMYDDGHRGSVVRRQPSDSTGSRRHKRRPEEVIDEWPAPASTNDEQERLDRVAELADDISALLDKITFDLDLNQIYQRDPTDPAPSEAV